jgi:hypothetical protein
MPWGERFPAGDVGALDDARERMKRDQADHRIADVARAYCAARKANEGALYSEWESERTKLDVALHNLYVAVGYPCEFCESGSCPGEAL